MGDVCRARAGLSVFVARDGSRAQAFTSAMTFFAPETEMLHFPAWDCLPYDRAGPSAATAAQRMAVLSRLARIAQTGKPMLLITTAAALMQRVPPKAAVAGAGYSAAVGASVDIAELERYFAINGYQRASTVSERGEFAIRGGVIDVFPPSAAEPVRLDLFGDTLESIRAFDRETQRSTRQLKTVELPPASEVLVDTAAVARFRTGYLAAFGAPGEDPLYETVSAGGRRAGMEHWLPLFYEGLDTLFDYLPAESLIAIDHLAAEARSERAAMVVDAYDARVQTEQRVHYRALPPSTLFLDNLEWDRRLDAHPVRRFSPFQREAAEGVVDMGAKLGRTFAGERARDSVNLFEAAADHARALAAAGKRVIFASWSEGSSERLAAMLADHGLTDVPLAPYWQAAKAADPRKLQRAALPLDAGFETDVLAVISETDILGDRLARPRRRRRASNFLAEATALGQGDLVVHIDHGIGRYEGLKTLDVMGAPHDCLELHYAEEGQALSAGGEHRPSDPLRLRERRRAGRPPGRGRLAGAQGQGQGTPARHGRGPDRHRRRQGHPRDRGHRAAARSVRRVLRPLPLRGDRRPAERHRRRACRPGRRPAHGPADLRRRGFRQDRGRPARRLRHGHERPPGGDRLPDHPAGAPALCDLHRAFPGLAGARPPLVAPGSRGRGGRDRARPRSRRARPRSSSAPTRSCPNR